MRLAFPGGGTRASANQQSFPQTSDQGAVLTAFAELTTAAFVAGIATIVSCWPPGRAATGSGCRDRADRM